VLVGAVVATTSWVFTHSMRSAGEREVEAELTSDAKLIGHALRSGQMPEDVLAELPRPGLSWLVVREGRISRTKLMPELERERLTIESRCLASDPRDSREQAVGAQRLRNLRVPAGHQAHCCLLRSLDAVFERSRSVQTTLFAVGRGAVLLALLCSGLLGFALMGRVQRILHAMQQAAGGDFDVDLPRNGHDEITALARGLDHMIRKLRGAQAELQSSAAHDREAALAAKLRGQLLPLQPSINGFEFAARIIPAPNGGGDFYETYQGEKASFVAVGNISGSGVQPGLTMVIVDSLLLATLRASREPAPSPAAILRQVGAALFESLRKRMHDDQMVSVLLLRHDGGKVTFSGHLPKLLLYRDGPRTVEQLEVDRASLAVSTQLDERLSDHSVQLVAGDAIVLLTDGITEAHNAQGDRLHIDRLSDEIVKTARSSTAAELRDHLLDVVSQHVGTSSRDLTIVVLRRDPATSKSQQGRL
jgi:sigma-B regulation protein RsbU (phosphoserine phosphatase)